MRNLINYSYFKASVYVVAFLYQKTNVYSSFLQIVSLSFLFKSYILNPFWNRRLKKKTKNFLRYASCWMSSIPIRILLNSNEGRQKYEKIVLWCFQKILLQQTYWKQNIKQLHPSANVCTACYGWTIICWTRSRKILLFGTYVGIISCLLLW